MSIHFGTSGFVFERGTWQPEVLAKLESHHIAAWSDDTGARSRFGASLVQFLVAQAGTEVCVLHGRNILDLEGLCSQLERLIPVDTLARSVDGSKGLASILRTRGPAHSRIPTRQRFFIWHDADVLIRNNPDLFGQVAEVIAGVSAELEYAGDGALMIQRCVYIGGPRLAEVARDTDSMLNRWADDGPGVPFWSLVTGEENPMTTLCSIDSLIESF
ncbi:MAG: hypothetical protein JKX70_10230 [Phycisphaerales bacterium]|nr:hypothetical protein [Phycisphaerales bacterium]